MVQEDSRRLLWHSVLLFLLGLMSGSVIPFMVNRRMGLSNHLVGTLEGTFLAVLGLIVVTLAPFEGSAEGHVLALAVRLVCEPVHDSAGSRLGHSRQCPRHRRRVPRSSVAGIHRRVRVQFARGCDGYRLPPADLRTPRNARRIFLSFYLIGSLPGRRLRHGALPSAHQLQAATHEPDRKRSNAPGRT